jgi:hypothetical protein
MDLFGGLLGSVSQVANLIGHHCEPTASLTGTRSFDRSVKGKQVGLLGNAFDHIKYVTNVVGAGINRARVVVLTLAVRKTALLHHSVNANKEVLIARILAADIRIVTVAADPSTAVIPALFVDAINIVV